MKVRGQPPSAGVLVVVVAGLAVACVASVGCCDCAPTAIPPGDHVRRLRIATVVMIALIWFWRGPTRIGASPFPGWRSRPMERWPACVCGSRLTNLGERQGVAIRRG